MWGSRADTEIVVPPGRRNKPSGHTTEVHRTRRNHGRSDLFPKTGLRSGQVSLQEPELLIEFPGHLCEEIRRDGVAEITRFLNGFS